MADTGHGATLAFATSGFTAQYRSLGGASTTREAIDTSHLGTTTGRTFSPGDISDNGEIEGTLLYDPDEQPPFNAAAETVTLTYPIPSGGLTGATEAFTGFITNWTKPTLSTDELMESSITIKISGDVTYTDST